MPNNTQATKKNKTCAEILAEIRSKPPYENLEYRRRMEEGVNRAEGRGWND